MLSLHFKPMLLEDVANSRDFIIRCCSYSPMPYGQRASSNISCFDCKYKQKSAYMLIFYQKKFYFFSLRKHKNKANNRIRLVVKRAFSDAFNFPFQTLTVIDSHLGLRNIHGDGSFVITAR